jgi:arylsulfatase A-like enzyme
MNNLVSMRRYAAEISGVDDGVGALLQTISRLGLEEQTLIVFTADQGLGCGQHGLWGMGDHTRPLHAFDPTMHVPLVFRHPGGIEENQRCNRIVANYDLMPTILGYLGLGTKMPARPASPGRDFSSTLHGQEQVWTDVVFYEFENTRAIRTDAWKLVLRHPSGPNELYNLVEDPGEWLNLFREPDFADQRAALTKQLTSFFGQYADPKYDLWKGGTSQTARLTK